MTKTAERLNAMSLQEIFDFVNDAITKQGVPSFDSELGDCAYRGPNGLKCAAGWLLDDADYDRELEGKGAADMCNAVGFRVGEAVHAYANIITIKRELLQRLQSAHDNAARDFRAPMPSQEGISFLQLYAEKMEHVRAWLSSPLARSVG
jgi:hypothetical protein